MTDLGPHIGDDLHDALRFALLHARPGAAVEFGVGVGTTLRMLAADPRLDPVIGFDSFQGLPEQWRPGFPAGRFACDPPAVPGANLVIGWYADTLPVLFGPQAQRQVPGWVLDLSLVHIDCDLGSSTDTILEYLGPYLTPGTIIVFDEFHSYPEAADNEARAWADYTERTGTAWQTLGHGPEQLVIRIT